MSEYGPDTLQRQQEPKLDLFKSYHYFSETPRWKGFMRMNVHYMHEKGFTVKQIAEILFLPITKVALSIKGPGPGKAPPAPKPPKTYKLPYKPRVRHKPYMPRTWREKI